MNKTHRISWRIVLCVVLTVLMAFAAQLVPFADDIIAQDDSMNVAKIGTQGYETLAEALIVANAGDTITLLADVTEDVTISKAVTIDGQGFTLGGTVKLAVESETPTTFKNLVFKTTKTNGIYVGATSYNVTFDACTFNGATSYTFEIPAGTSANNFRFINECEVNMPSGFMQISGTASDMVVDGMHIVKCGNGFKVNKCGNAITFNGVTVDDAYIFIYGMGYSDMSFVINDCTIKAAFPFVRQDKAVMTYTYTFTGENEVVANLDSTAPVVSTEYDGMYLVKGSDLGSTVVWNVPVPTYVAKIGETGYKTLEEAFAAAKSGETVELIADAYEDIVIPSEFNGTLAIGTCTIKSITNNSASAKIVINGNVVVENSNGSAITGEYINISGSGTLTAIANGDHAYGIGGDYTKSITIENVHILNVKGGHIQPLFVNDTSYGKTEPEGGAGIGSGYNGAVINLTNVTIDKALGGSKAAGIGARYWTGVTINIDGCTIKNVEGGNGSAGIGGSRVSEGATSAEAVTINITNSTITAKGGQAGAGIGSGYDTHCQAKQPICTINIDGSTINATGGKYAAGIGTGYHNAGLAGEIKNSTITAVSGEKVYKDKYTSAQDIGFGVADLTREGSNNDSYITYNGTKITLPRKVAQIVDANGNVVNTYSTLQEAIANANAGDTIIFLADITEDVTISKNVTINGANFKYTGTMTGAPGANITVQNVKFVNGGFAKSTKSTTGTYTIKNCSFDGQGSYPYPFLFKGANTIVIEDCTVEDYLYSFLYVTSSATNVSVKNVTVEDCPNYAVYFASGVANAIFEKLTVKNSNNGFIINNTAVRSFTIKDCKMENVTTAIKESNGTSSITCTALGANDFGTATISQYAKVVLAETSATLTAPEGYDVITNVDGYAVKYANGTYTLIVPVAEINGVKYGSLAEALAAANAGDTITFLADITEDVTVSTKVTIDGAGKTYTGKMTLKADTTIKNVNFDGKGYNGYAVETRGADYLTVENCTAKNYGYGFIQLASGTVLTTVKNVIVSNMNYGVKVDYSNAVVLENVDITASVAAVLNSNYGEKTITIKNSKLSILGTWTRNNTTKTNYVFEGANSIESFIIDAAIDNFKLADKDSTLTAPEGQIVTTDVENSVVNYKDGKYIVAAAVAKIGDTLYGSLTDALAAAKNGDTVTLLVNVTCDEKYVLVLNKGITLDLNGNTLTVDYIVAFKGNHVVDSTRGTGLLIVDENNIVLASDNANMAVLTSEGYKFASVKLNYNYEVNDSNTGFTVKFRPGLGSTTQAFLKTADSVKASGMQIIVRFSWTGKDGMVRYQDAVCNAAQIADMYKVSTSDSSGALFVTLNNVGDYKDLSATLMVISDTGVQASQHMYTFNPTTTQ